MLRILVVDDDEDVLSSMGDVLRFAFDEAQVETANSGADALARVRTDGLDTLVTDYRMPGMDGLQLAEAAHRQEPGLPIIMVTAYNDRDLENAASSKGIRTVVHKPFDIGELVDAVRSGLAASTRSA